MEPLCDVACGQALWRMADEEPEDVQAGFLGQGG